jgi:hypothetical protein
VRKFKFLYSYTQRAEFEVEAPNQEVAETIAYGKGLEALLNMDFVKVYPTQEREETTFVDEVYDAPLDNMERLLIEGTKNDLPCCYSKDCPFKSECAQHDTAGDYRFEDGYTPKLVYFPSLDQVWCTKEVLKLHGALRLKNGDFDLIH